jgi:hypothetical protein
MLLRTPSDETKELTQTIPGAPYHFNSTPTVPWWDWVVARNLPS